MLQRFLSFGQSATSPGTAGAWLAIAVGILMLVPGQAATASVTDAQLGPGEGAGARAPAPAIRHGPEVSFQLDEFYIHVPANPPVPMRVLLAFNGMGGTGQQEAGQLAPQIGDRGWVTVAPTYDYGNWWDTNRVIQEEKDHLPRITALLDDLPGLLGGPVDSQVLVYGFSRGAQTANRWALAFPERVAAVAVASGGAYTLPRTWVGDEASPLNFPFGVADLRAVVGHGFDSARFNAIPFWIGVGGQDTDTRVVPPNWGVYLGENRVERAQRFADWLGRSGARVQFQIFAELGHEQTDALAGAALDFLDQATSGAFYS